MAGSSIETLTARKSRDYVRYVPFLIAVPGILLACFLLRDQLLSKDEDSSALLMGDKVKDVQGIDIRNHQTDEQNQPGESSDDEIRGASSEIDVSGSTQERNGDLQREKIYAPKTEIHQGILKGFNGMTSEAEAASTKSQVRENLPSNPQHRPTCQIVYIVGVEGSGHHGVSDQVMLNLAREQLDSSGKKYRVLFRSPRFRKILNASPATPGGKVDDTVIESKMKELCGTKHGGESTTVILDDISFPTGFATRKKFTGLTAPDIEAILNLAPTPVDLRKFGAVFSRYADVKYVVLHRPFFNVAVSHAEWKLDGGIIEHGTVIAGHLRHLGNVFGENTNENMVGPVPWKLLCVNQLRKDASVQINGNGRTKRDNVISELSAFLGWPSAECTFCFTKWYDSNKDPAAIAGQEAIEALTKQRDELSEIWPPPGGGVSDCPL